MKIIFQIRLQLWSLGVCFAWQQQINYLAIVKGGRRHWYVMHPVTFRTRAIESESTIQCTVRRDGIICKWCWQTSCWNSLAWKLLMEISFSIYLMNRYGATICQRNSNNLWPISWRGSRHPDESASRVSNPRAIFTYGYISVFARVAHT